MSFLSPRQGMFYSLKNENNTLVNYAVDPVVREYDRMIYLALSEYFFDSGLYAYYTGGLFQMQIANERVRRGTCVFIIQDKCGKT